MPSKNSTLHNPNKNGIIKKIKIGEQNTKDNEKYNVIRLEVKSGQFVDLGKLFAVTPMTD